ncbi:MAG: FMN-binding protein [Eubacterium sp.]|nr:FMN-binding protein [Eubacterium sp.]MCI2197921.1 FMN-binding protein [Eubacterium sp.]
MKNGKITDITVESYEDDDQFFNQAQSTVIDENLSNQSVNVDTVSGAAYSSNGILEAVADALNISFDNPNDSTASERSRR